MNVEQLIEKLSKLDDKHVEVITDPTSPSAQSVADVESEDGIVYLIIVD